AGAFIRDTVDILRRNPGYRWFTASVFVSGFGNLMATTLYPIYQVDHFHITNTQVANMQNIQSLATIVGYLFWGGFLDKKGPLVTVLVAIGINLAVPLLYAESISITSLYAASLAMGICLAGVDLAYLNTTLLFAEEGKASQYQALHSSFFGIRGSIAPQCAVPMMGLVGARNAFRISFCVIVAGVWLQVISMRDYRRQEKSGELR
ncbi:MAG: MFS transporter, partial [Chthonomonadales bacterium]